MPESPYSAGHADHRESADHVAVDHIVVFSAGRVFALLRQDFEVVTVEWLRLITSGLFAVTFATGVGHQEPSGLIWPLSSVGQ